MRSTRLTTKSLLLLAALALALPTGAAPLNHGCGFRLRPGAIATWFAFGAPTNPPTVVPIDQAARPWGPTGDGREDHVQYTRRYAGGDPLLEKRGGMTPQGEANERGWQTVAVLRAACLDGLFGAGWDCEPTQEEENDYAFTVKRGTGLYARYASLFAAPGGAPAPALGPTPGPLPPPLPTPVPACPAGESCRPAPAPCPVLTPVPTRIRETVHVLEAWPRGRAMGPGLAARVAELARWLGKVVDYRPVLESTGRAGVSLTEGKD